MSLLSQGGRSGGRESREGGVSGLVRLTLVRLPSFQSLITSVAMPPPPQRCVTLTHRLILALFSIDIGAAISGGAM